MYNVVGRKIELMETVREQTFEYWHEVFESYGFRRDSLHGSCSRFTWFSKGDFHVGFDPEDFRSRTCPSFYVEYSGGARDVTVEVRLIIGGFKLAGSATNYNTVEDYLFALRAVSELKLVPLAIGIPWMQGIVSASLKEELV